jgi:hypothetical protein
MMITIIMLSLWFSKHRTMMAYGGVAVLFHVFLTAELGVEANGLFHVRIALPSESHRYRLSRRLGGSRAGLDAAVEMKILFPALAGNRTHVIETVA